MSAATMTKEEKKQLTNARQNAVRSAWKDERTRVEQGQGTRDWSPDEQKELLSTGRVSGYEGHHMKSVSLFPEQAGNPENIQFLSESEHLDGAHQGSYHNATNGYYDPQTGIMHEFAGDELQPAPVCALSERYHLEQKSGHGVEGGQNTGGQEFDYTGPAMAENTGDEGFDYTGGSSVEGTGQTNAARQSAASAGPSQGSDSGQGYG